MGVQEKDGIRVAEKEHLPDAGGYYRPRIAYIDSLKGFGALCVVLGHIVVGYNAAGMYQEHAVVLNTAGSVIYAFHMPFFFIISGYLYHHSYFDNIRPNRSRIFRQMLNLIFIYLVFSVAFGLFKVLCARYTNGETTFRDVLLIGIHAIAPYWYLYVLIIYYLLFSVPAFFGPKRPLVIMALLIGICVCNKSVPPTAPFELKYAMCYLPFFYVGMLCSSGVRIFSNAKALLFCFAVSVVLFGMLFYAENGHISYDAPGDKIIVSFGFSAMLWFLFEKISAIGNCCLLQICGKYAMEIYVLHCIFTAGNRVVLQRLGITEFYLNVICNVIISTSLPIVFASVCRKLGVYELLFKPMDHFAKQR